MKPIFRRLILYGLLCGTLIFSYSVFRAEGSAATEVVAPNAKRPAIREQVVAADDSSGISLERMARTYVAANDANPFAMKSWATAAPAVAKPVPATTLDSAPVAPPLPYSFAGKLDLDGGVSVMYLVKGEQSFAVSKGEIFDNNYRLEGMQDGNLVIVYLPLNSKQLLPVGTE
ncbi:hypothetical protein [Duganella radicis]|uniref:Secretion system X translation initiation factor n=1 Tax=Duganella radicis TaxID=551988 RepID=A0A6L6PP83_9BURK|nr:hypothetical protein [Duganella radicis]MTV40559.1 hypothetical protein [Duganella radicis]